MLLSILMILLILLVMVISTSIFISIRLLMLTSIAVTCIDDSNCYKQNLKHLEFCFSFLFFI